MSARILLVDDDRLIREVIGEYLISRGYEVDLAEEGYEALTMFCKQPYNLILIDGLMQRMTGLELMRLIHARDKHALCMIMTGHKNLDSVKKSMREGISDFIIKPFRLPELLNLVQKYV